MWEIGNRKASKTPENADIRAEAKISSFRLLPWASVCFRDRLVAVVLLVSELYPTDGVGKFGGWGGGILGNGTPAGAKNQPKTRIPGRDLKFIASVCVRGLPSASAGFRASAAAWPRWFR